MKNDLKQMFTENNIYKPVKQTVEFSKKQQSLQKYYLMI